MSYLPLMLNMDRMPVTVVGGGSIALKKINILMEYKPSITVISETFDEEFKKLNVKKIAMQINRETDMAPFISRSKLVVIATNSNEINDLVENYCKKIDVLYNRVDRKESTFIFPALLKMDSITVAVSTSGSLPGFSKFLRDQIKTSLKDYISAFDLLKKIRDGMPADSYSKRYSFFEKLLSNSDFWLLVKNENFEKAEDFAKELWEAMK